MTCRKWPILVTLALLGSGCAERESPEQAARERAVAARVQAGEDARIRAERVAAQQRETQAATLPTTDASWTMRAEEDALGALFGPAEGDARLAVDCDRTQRELVFTRALTVAPGPVDVRLTNGAQSTVVPGTSATDPTARVTAAIPLGHPLVAGLGTTRDPILIQIGDGEPLAAPVSDELRGVITQCA